MTTTLQSPVGTPKTGRMTKPAVACGIAAGGLVTGCCGVGVLGAVTFGFGINAGFFALNNVPGGSTPILTLAGLLLSLGATWLFMRHRLAGLPVAVARPAMRRALGVTAFTGAATFFVLMELVIPLLFLITGGAVHMGMFFPHKMG